MTRNISPETRLLNLIEEVLFKKRQGESHEAYKDRTAEPWRGSAGQLEKELRSSPFTFAVKRLLYYSSCGVYLARLASKYPGRFEQRKVKGRSEWLISKVPSCPYRK